MFLNDKKDRDADTNTVTYVFFGVVPPCTAVQVPKNLVYSTAAARSPDTNTDWLLQGLHFMTSDGQPWVRMSNGQLGKTTSPPPKGVIRQQKSGGLIADDKAKQSPLSECKAPS